MPDDAKNLPPEIAYAPAYTLVVGAGINAGRGVPGWQALVESAWSKVGRDADQHSNRSVRLSQARDAVKRYCQWSDDEIRDLVFRTHPLEPQFILELIDAQISGDRKLEDEIRNLIVSTGPINISVNSGTLTPLLLAALLYKDVRRDGSPDTLSELADFVRSSDSVKRVISLNVDNLLEIEVNNFGLMNSQRPFLEVVSRHRHQPSLGIPTYHLHGFLPINVFQNSPGWSSVNPRVFEGRMTAQTGEHMTEPVPESFIFTDLQYWESFSRPLSFANFVFANALHDSCCIFIGLSMADLNIIRWLGLHTVELGSEYAREFSLMGRPSSCTPLPYLRHCWLASQGSDPRNVISSLLARRGVHTHLIRSWKPEQIRGVLGQLSGYQP